MKLCAALFTSGILLQGTSFSRGAEVVPPVMSPRPIAPSTTPPPGEQFQLSDRGTNFTVFLPVGWTNTLSSNSVLVVHFHTAPWFAIQEHLRRNAREPLLVFALGEGSTNYRIPFEDTNRFPRIVAQAEDELRRRSGNREATISAVDVSSFSAGYGAVRELVRTPASFRLLRRIVLLDSRYGGLEPMTGGVTNRVPLAEHIDVWVPFVRAAMRSEKTFVLTHTQIATRSYASTFECAAALLQRVGIPPDKIAPGSTPAAAEPRYPLLTRADRGCFHIWSYTGDDAESHMTHPRHLANVWEAIDAAR
jgi:hypothetical protein